jgi:hypothetical protein
LLNKIINAERWWERSNKSSFLDKTVFYII